MTGRRFVIWFARGAIVAFSLTAAFVGCSRQGEGERCVRLAAGNTDCDEGLVCVSCVNLAEGVVDRCCPENAGSASDDRCRRSDPPRNAEECPTEGQTGGTGGSASSTGGASGRGGSGGSGATSGGTAGSSGTGGESGASDAAGAGGV